jgi:hypothetical protein
MEEAWTASAFSSPPPNRPSRSARNKVLTHASTSFTAARRDANELITDWQFAGAVDEAFPANFSSASASAFDAYAR